MKAKLMIIVVAVLLFACECHIQPPEAPAEKLEIKRYQQPRRRRRRRRVMMAATNPGTKERPEIK